MQKKILVIDDNRMNVRILSDILETEEYHVYSLLDATKVMETVLLIQPDAILLDIVMPRIDGIEVCSILQNKDETKNIPVIMVTSVTDSTILRKAFDIGAFDYIKKPFDHIEVIARLKSAIRYYEQQKKLETLAMKDGLTNLYNHRTIMELMEKEFQRAIRDQFSIAFLMFDIDNFKKVNDTYGHSTGDCVLKHVGNLLQVSPKLSDLIGRYGGEEFCIILSGQSLENVLTYSERLRKSIETHDFSSENIQIHVTTSIGISYKKPLLDSSVNDMIITADQKLYTAKKNGRNRIEYQVL